MGLLRCDFARRHAPPLNENSSPTTTHRLGWVDALAVPRRKSLQKQAGIRELDTTVPGRFSILEHACDGK
jgi:hypothetical protein